MIELPYGLADFRAIRQGGLVYVDRTAHIRDLERLGRILVFLRPRRFGKSLWLQTLANYYDLRRAAEFDELFGGLAAGDAPTPLRNRYFVLQWNFSTVSAAGSVEQIAESLRDHVSTRAKTFAAQYAEHLPGPVEVDGSSAAVIGSLLRVVEQTPYKLYLLIDEYDNFVNEVMVQDAETYRALFGRAGPYKELFKTVKTATEGQGLERVFVTGVSPVALNDLTSGFNNAEDVSQKPALATLCGFRRKEVEDLLESIATERDDVSPEAVRHALDTMETWYDGYRFAAGVDEPLYNPTNALYFLKSLYLEGKPPELLHDENLRTDRDKLAFMGRTAAGSGVIEKLTEGDGTIDVPRLVASFSVDDLTVRLAKDPGAVASLLFYTGLLTLTDTPRRLRIPNLVVRRLFLDRLLEIYLPDFADSSAAREIAMRFFRSGDLAPLLAFFERKLLPVFSNRDRGAAPRKHGGRQRGDLKRGDLQHGDGGTGVNEMVVKSLFLAILFDDTRYVVASEVELERRYADLCLLVRDEMRAGGYFDFLFEFKLVRRKELGRKGQELRDMDETALKELSAVKRAFADAREQIERYRERLAAITPAASRLRCYAVVAVGLERILGEEVASKHISAAASAPRPQSAAS